MMLWNRGMRRGAGLGLWTVALAGLTSLISHAQVVLDGKFGAAGPLAGPDYRVSADLGLTRGNNLFHSFSQFNLASGESATFSGPANIQNLLSRVTGGGPSSIDGTLRSEIAGANFFFINPQGVLFGPNARVDVSGSFAASTADYLRLADGARFVASLDADDSLLSTAPVSAFGFLDGASGSLEVSGLLQAGPETGISLIGSAVTVGDGARLQTENGHIVLMGANPGSEIDLPRSDSAASQTGPNLPPPSANASVVIRGGKLVVDNARITASQPGGNVDLALSAAVEVVNGSEILTGSLGSDVGGNILVRAPSVRVDGTQGMAPTRIAAESFGATVEAAGGNIRIEADSLEVLPGAEISVSSFGPADAGRIEIQASSLLVQGSEMVFFPTQIAANASPMIGGKSGSGGEIVINADSVTVTDFAGILAATAGDADAGTIHITARSLRLENAGLSTFTAGAGAGGAIRIETDQLTLDGPFASITALTTGFSELAPAGDGGQIDIRAGQLQLLNDAAISATTFGDGRGGNISIAADSVLLDTATFQSGSIPGISAASNPPFFGESTGGRGGDITLTAGSLTLRDGMVISAATYTAADGGSISLEVGSLTLDGRSEIQSASFGTGRAGALSLRASGDVLLTGNSLITTSAPESSGGDILMQAGDTVQIFGGGVTAQAGPGGGGNITVLAPSLIYLLDSTLTAQAVGDGGNLNIDPVFFILNHSALISKSSSANGGNITILADYFFRSASIIDASAPFGLPGTVQVSAPEVDLSGRLVALPGNLMDIENQLQPDCAVRFVGDISSFVVLGRGGLPLVPAGFMPSGVPVSSYDDQP
jgi:filamentous hemagglutinin family protein